MIATRTIETTFAEDHDRLEDLFRNFQHWKREHFDQGLEYFREFKAGLQRHIVWEEQILFPRFEQKTGMIHAGPTVVMRLEHRQIGEALEALHRKVQLRDPESDAEEQHLQSLLTEHNHKEESVLYPALDRMLTAAEKAEVFAEMDKVPEEMYRTCCGHH